MLVLSRKRNESIVIGDDLVLTVVGICGNKVRLGFSGSPDISVHRKEVFDAIHGGEWRGTVVKIPNTLVVKNSV